MKPIELMTRLELASYIGLKLRENGINVVLSGGSCVSIYSNDQYVSMDLDFINVNLTSRKKITKLMESLGFYEENRYFKHSDTDLFVEFPPGPLGVGEEPVKTIDEISTDVGKLYIISPTDCVKDRLTWYYHDRDLECLRQAVLVCSSNKIDLLEIERWSIVEGKKEDFLSIKTQLNRPNLKRFSE